MKYFSVLLLLVVFAAACFAEDNVALAGDEKKTEKRGIYGFGYGLGLGHGYGGHYGGYGGHYGGFGGHYGGHGYPHSIGYLQTPYYGHGYYPHGHGYYHGLH